jgi:hypothetical protein
VNNEGVWKIWTPAGENPFISHPLLDFWTKIKLKK